MSIDPCWLCKLFGIGQDTPIEKCQPRWWEQIDQDVPNKNHVNMMNFRTTRAQCRHSTLSQLSNEIPHNYDIFMNDDGQLYCEYYTVIPDDN